MPFSFEQIDAIVSGQPLETVVEEPMPLQIKVSLLNGLLKHRLVTKEPLKRSKSVVIVPNVEENATKFARSDADLCHSNDSDHCDYEIDLTRYDVPTTDCQLVN